MTIPNSVTSIGDGAFDDCSSLTGSISWQRPSVTEFLRRHMHRLLWPGQGKARSFTVFPIGLFPTITRAIRDTAYYGLQQLAGVTNVTSCQQRRQHRRGGVLRNAPAWISVNIPASIASIGGYAFYACTSLTNITIGTNVTSIGEGAFVWLHQLDRSLFPR